MDKKEKQKRIIKARTLTESRFKEYRGCAQTTLYAVADTIDMQITDDVFKAVAFLFLKLEITIESWYSYV